MNDGHDRYDQGPYDSYADDPYRRQPRVYGYDEYGRPVYQPPTGQPPAGQGYDPASYDRPPAHEGYGYDPYSPTPQRPGAQPQGPHGAQRPHAPYDPSYGGYQGPHDRHPQQTREQGYGYAEPYDTGSHPVVPAQREPAPGGAPGGGSRGPGGQPGGPGGPGGGADGPEGDSGYRTEQFSFVEEPDEDSDDVIDWLKFAETRTERRDERRRRARTRVVALVVVLVLAAVGGVGYLWHAGKLPGLSDNDQQTAAAGGAQKRDAIVVHLRETNGNGSSTALLVDNETAKKGSTVLLPNTLSLPTEDGGSTTLAKSVVDDGSEDTRNSLSTLLGADIQGTWRLDTPYLENLVELVGGIHVNADATVPASKKGDPPLVKRGRDQALNGQAAVAYATYRGPGEPQTTQLARFGQVMRGVLDKISDDQGSAISTVQSLAQVPDPSLSEKQLGASLARLAERAQTGEYQTTTLRVRPDGTLSERDTQHVVKSILGGAVKRSANNAAPRITVQNAGGGKGAANTARVTLVNGGFTVVGATEDGGAARSASQVTYAEKALATQAKEIAKTLGLPAGAVRKGKVTSNADIVVTLGGDYDAKAAGAGG